MALTIKEIGNQFKIDDIDTLKSLIDEYSSDEREGVQKFINQAKKKLVDFEKEVLRTEKLKEFEKKYESLGYVCGIDEVGRGPLAGPVVAGAVILPKDCDILYLNDSKQLTAKKREEL